MITIFCIRPRGFNIGNEAIYVAMQPFLQAAFGEVVNVITLPATGRYETDLKAGLTPKTVYEINQYGDGVIVGGGNLYENGEIDVNLGALSALEAPLMLFSLSNGRIYNRKQQLVPRTNAISPEVVRALHAKATVSLARDASTLRYLHGLGAENAQLGGCPTIFINAIENRLPILPVSSKGTVLISVRNPQLMSIPLQKQIDVHSHIRNMVEFLRGEGCSDVKLFCHDHRDIPFAASFLNIDYLYADDVYTYLALLKNCALNITYRLHSALPCLSFGRPVIKISYDERASSLFDTIGYSSWNVNMMEDPDPVKAVIDRYRRLDELPSIRNAVEPTWRNLHTAMSTGFARFTDAVRHYRKEVNNG